MGQRCCVSEVADETTYHVNDKYPSTEQSQSSVVAQHQWSEEPQSLCYETHVTVKEQSVAKKVDSSIIDKAVIGMKLTNPDGGNMTYISHKIMDDERRRVLATAFPDCASHTTVAIVAKAESGEMRELVAVCIGDAPPKLLFASCQIMYEELSPSECIEYCFKEAPEQWAMAQISLDALESYRGMKFEAWRKMLFKPTCEAQFRRMLQIGMLTQLFDPHVFPTPERFRTMYQVTDEKTGKLIQLPHPVAALRVWNVMDQTYESIDPHLTGAPSLNEKDVWWNELLKSLKAQHGEEYITAMMMK